MKQILVTACHVCPYMQFEGGAYCRAIGRRVYSSERFTSKPIADCPLEDAPTGNQGMGENCRPTPQGQNGTAGKPQVGECTTSAIA